MHLYFGWKIQTCSTEGLIRKAVYIAKGLAENQQFLWLRSLSCDFAVAVRKKIKQQAMHGWHIEAMRIFSSLKTVSSICFYRKEQSRKSIVWNYSGLCIPMPIKVYLVVTFINVQQFDQDYDSVIELREMAEARHMQAFFFFF